MTKIAAAEGAPQAEVVQCLEDNAPKNSQMVTERFPGLNEKIATFSKQETKLWRTEIMPQLN
jgi:hypothetical protein